ncbi:MAG: hypothetical protein JNJ71_12750 [Rubrivivax sp.]|nr:hypothetical protein [Rubrivivax sp.]
MAALHLAPRAFAPLIKPRARGVLGLGASCLLITLAAPAVAETFVVSSLADSGPGSLRQAVAQANANPGLDLIRFGVSGTIELQTPLDVADDLRIDGGNQRVVISGGDRSTLIVQSDAGKWLELMRLSFARASYSQSTGGAIHAKGTLRLVETLFTDNVAPVGGAVFSNGPRLVIVNSTFASNRALSWGGAVAVGPSTEAIIVSTTFVANDAAQFGGTVFQNPIFPGSNYTGSMVLRNTLISGVAAQGNCSVISNRLIDGGGNLNSDGSCPFTQDKGSANHVNPMLGELAQHGGPTRSFAPLPGSPAIDSGIDALLQGLGVTTDQRGYQRVAGSRVDRGAFEVQAGDRTAAVPPRP